MSRVLTRLRELAKEQATQDQLILSATSGGGSGASLAWSDATMTIPSAVRWREQSFVAAVSPSNVVEVMLAAAADTDENCPELLDVTALYATAGSGQFVVTASFSAPTSGDIKLKYRVA